MKATGRPIRVNALKVRQRADVPVFVFGIDGKLVQTIASVSQAHRTKAGVLTGYQRGPAEKHIREILDYLATPDALLPNAIVIAFNSDVVFAPLPGFVPSEWGTFGHLTIPIPANAEEDRAGWIVDGQQRITALSRLESTKHFPIVVVAFQSEGVDLQRNQFVLVNKTKPLPRNLLNEVLPDVSAPLPKTLARQQLAAKVVLALRFDEHSPFAGRIRGIDSDSERCTISQNAILEVVQNSTKQKGALFFQYDPAQKKESYRRMANVLSVFYEGVRRTWPKAWDGTPSTSRLVHGAGIVALGALMDQIMKDINAESPKAASVVQNRLTHLKDRCAWTSGRWPKLGRAWNEIQNTSQDKQALADYLLREYTAGD
jgi:DGQHR domain-containing protein